VIFVPPPDSDGGFGRQLLPPIKPVSAIVSAAVLSFVNDVRLLMRKDLLHEPLKAGSLIDSSFQVPGLTTGSIAYFRDLGNGILLA